MNPPQSLPENKWKLPAFPVKNDRSLIENLNSDADAGMLNHCRLFYVFNCSCARKIIHFLVKRPVQNIKYFHN